MSPLIFVVSMEHLLRCLNLAALCEDFKFHLSCTCKALQLDHLSFADYIILMCGNHLRSVQIRLD